MGRPKKIDFELWQLTWTAIEALRESSLLSSGRRFSVTKAAEYLADSGGVATVLGGHHNLPLTDEMLRKKYKRYQLPINGPGGISGTLNILADYACTYSKTIRNLYVQADKLAKNDPQILFAWRNMVRDRLGQPRQVDTRHAYPGRQLRY